jgi:hypothetical protein
VALYRLLAWLAVDRVLLVGQDFAWRGDRSHVAGHHAAATPATAEVKDRDGNTLRSALPYVTAKRELESDIAKTGLATANLYGGGAAIQGAPELDLQAAHMQGWLASEPGGVQAFLQAMHDARAPQPPPQFEQKHGQWASSLRSAQKRLDKLFKRPEKRSEEIWNTLRDVHFFLRQDPLYLPYLYNEIMDAASLVHPPRRYGPEDRVKIKDVIKRSVSKVRKMDQLLASGNQAAA